MKIEDVRRAGELGEAHRIAQCTDGAGGSPLPPPMGDGLSLPSRLMDEGRSKNSAVAMTSQPIIIIIIMLNPPALDGSELGPGNS